MKTNYLLFIIISVLAWSCSSDDGPDISGDRTVLNYDDANVTAPTFGPGLFELAVRFPSMLTNNLVGKSIEQVSFYLYDAPAELYINLSADLTPTLPGEILNTQRVTGLTPNAWNTVSLTTPYPLDGSAVWVGIEVTVDQPTQTVGCDAGPANPNGDWLYTEDDMTWATFNSRTNQNESVNWNIRAIVSE